MADNMNSDSCIDCKTTSTAITEETLIEQQKSPPLIQSSPSQHKHLSLSPSDMEQELDSSNQELGFDEKSQKRGSLCELESVSFSLQELSLSPPGDGEQRLESSNQELSFEEIKGEKKVSDCRIFECEKSSKDFVVKVVDFGEEVAETEKFVLSSSSVDVKEKNFEAGKEILLEAKKNQLVDQVEDFDVKVANFNEKVVETGNFVSNFGSDDVKERESGVGFPVIEKLDEESLIAEEMGKQVLLETKKKQLLEQIESLEINPGFLLGLKGIDESFRRERKVEVEVIDDTALIIPPAVPKNDNGVVKAVERKASKNAKHETDGKKAKGSRRKRKDAGKALEINAAQKETSKVKVMQSGHATNHCERRSDQFKYSREEMEALKFVNIVEQRKMWGRVCTDLGDVVMKEYIDSARSNSVNNNGFNIDPRLSFSRREAAPGILGEVSSENVENELENLEDVMENGKLFGLDIHGTGGEDAYMVSKDEIDEEEEDSDEEYASIQRPAFVVEGEPDFDSGPPEDGWEYLRRVRWEAARIPKVKVAKLDRSKLNKEQTVYMPQIPEIEKCPAHFLPLKEWEEEFLADFSKLRRSLERNEESSLIIYPNQQSVAFGDKESPSLPIHDVDSVLETMNRGNFQFHNSLDDSSVDLIKKEPSMANSEDSESLNSTVSAIVAMDSVTRVSKLQKHISLFETTDTLSKSDCVWLFAACAAVDTPLHADTCAALRSLLRKCARLRAQKSEIDDEVIMLNILITITGKYFGQSEG